MKAKIYDLYLWPTKLAAKLAVGDWIDRVYNGRRGHSALGMVSPVDFEDRLNQTAKAVCPCVHQTGSGPIREHSDSSGAHRPLTAEEHRQR